jgi:hypothetical protein
MKFGTHFLIRIKQLLVGFSGLRLYGTVGPMEWRAFLCRVALQNLLNPFV